MTDKTFNLPPSHVVVDDWRMYVSPKERMNETPLAITSDKVQLDI